MLKLQEYPKSEFRGLSKNYQIAAWILEALKYM